MYAPKDVDKQIIDQLRTGATHEAIAMLMKHHGPKVYGVLRRRFGSANDDELLQAIDDAGLSLWRDVKRFDPTRGSLGGWFLTCALNNTKNLLRARAAQPILELGENVPSRERETRSELTERKLAALRECLDQLSERQQHIVLSGLADGHSSDAELAQQLDTSAGAIGTARNKAMKRLGKLIEREMRSNKNVG